MRNTIGRRDFLKLTAVTLTTPCLVSSQSLEGITGHDFPYVYANDGYLCVRSRDVKTEKRLFKGESGVWDSSGKTIFYERTGREGISKFDPSTDSHETVVEEGNQPALSPNDQFLAFVKRGKVHYKNLDTGKIKEASAGVNPEWVSNHELTYPFDFQKTVYHDVIEGKFWMRPHSYMSMNPGRSRYVTSVIEGLNSKEEPVEFVTTSSLLTLKKDGSDRRDIASLNYRGNNTFLINGPVAWSPDGKKIAFMASHFQKGANVDPPNEVHVVNLESASVDRAPGEIRTCWGLTWGPDSKHLVVNYFDGLFAKVDADSARRMGQEIPQGGSAYVRINPFSLTEDNARNGKIRREHLEKDRLLFYNTKT
jgi:hypothetical protein